MLLPLPLLLICIVIEPPGGLESIVLRIEHCFDSFGLSPWSRSAVICSNCKTLYFKFKMCFFVCVLVFFSAWCHSVFICLSEYTDILCATISAIHGVIGLQSINSFNLLTHSSKYKKLRLVFCHFFCTFCYFLLHF